MNLEELKDKLYVAVLADVLDQLGFTRQATRTPFFAYTGTEKLMGRCKTTLWADMYHQDPHPYELELQAVDSCRPGDVLICAAGGSNRSGIWGELLSTAARNAGCVGVIVHGSVRDIGKMTTMGFPVFATGKNPYDSQNRQKVVDLDVVVEVDGVKFAPGDLVMADQDGIVVVPQHVEAQVLAAALEKVSAENVTRDAIRDGMKAVEAYQKFGVL
ncbi:MAG: RraA family protein [Dyadobacter sp.]|uniref:RraA family protein n=1 Tax=Dyadobacter sp. TaxID=1914288 RepID=UPI001B14E2ED|nr:RraA family protein [Dyadobacter sp.]MBO9611337.1 RraA family protein [Dyadobacter sp.]